MSSLSLKQIDKLVTGGCVLSAHLYAAPYQLLSRAVKKSRLVMAQLHVSIINFNDNVHVIVYDDMAQCSSCQHNVLLSTEIRCTETFKLPPRTYYTVCSSLAVRK